MILDAKKYRYLIYLATAVLLAGCVTSPDRAKVSVDPSSQARETTTDDPAEVDNEAHASGLTPELLYHLLVANLGYQRGENARATASLVQAANLSRDPRLLAQAARTTLHYKQYTAAAELGQLWLELDPADNAAFIITALAEIKRGSHDQASAVLSALIQQRPEDSKGVYQQLSAVLLQHASEPETLELVVPLVRQQPKLQAAWLMQAALAEKLKNEARLNEALDALLAIDPGDETAAVYKIASLEKHRPEQLDDFVNSFLQSTNDSTPVRLQYARSLLRLDRESDALAQYEAVLRQEPENADALYAAGLVHHGQGNYGKAAGFLRGRVEAKPDDDRARLYLGTALLELKRYDQSIVVLEGIKSEEYRHSAQRQIAINIEGKAGADAALSYLSQLHPSSDDESVQLLVDQQQVLRRAERYQQARELLDAGLQGFPDNSRILYHRALLAVDMQDIAGHEKDMRRLIEQEPDNANYLNTLGYTLLDLAGELDKARELIEKAMQLKPNDPYITDSMGWLEFKQGNLQAAAALLEKAFELDADAEIAAHLGEVYWAQGHPDKAKSMWQRGQEIDGENQTLLDTVKRFEP